MTIIGTRSRTTRSLFMEQLLSQTWQTFDLILFSIKGLQVTSDLCPLICCSLILVWLFCYFCCCSVVVFCWGEGASRLLFVGYF